MQPRHGRTQADWKSSDLPRYPELYLLIGVKLTHVTALARSARDDTVIQRSAITSYLAAIEDGKQPIRFVVNDHRMIYDPGRRESRNLHPRILVAVLVANCPILSDTSNNDGRPKTRASRPFRASECPPVYAPIRS